MDSRIPIELRSSGGDIARRFLPAGNPLPRAIYFRRSVFTISDTDSAATGHAVYIEGLMYSITHSRQHDEWNTADNNG